MLGQVVDLNRCLYSGPDGKARIEIPDGVLPEFVIQAFNLAASGRSAQAETLLTGQNLWQIEALEAGRYPGLDLVRLVLAMTCQRLQRPAAAARYYEQVLARRDHALVRDELAQVYRALGRSDMTRIHRRKALDLDPGNAVIRCNHVTDLLAEGRMAEGLQFLRETIAAYPSDDQMHSSLLFRLHYCWPEIDSETLLQEHLRWGRVHAPLHRARSRRDNVPDPERRLRIGYLSQDLREHPAASTMEALLDGHDAREVETFAYANVSRPDHVTGRLQGKFDHYRDIFGTDDLAVVRQIEQDRIDILVALAGHTGGHRLKVLAYKPAPIQVDMGSISTLGMAQVDYRLTDAVLDPPSSQAFYLECLVHIPSGYVCYRPPEDAPAVGPLPAPSRGVVTFGSFNNSLKINDYVLSLWAAVLREVKGSRLLLKFVDGGDPLLAGRFRRRLGELGVAEDRVQILGFARRSSDHLACYAQIDIALDTYPFNGCVTTFEGLWMGVPVVSLTGDKLISRVGLAMLTQVGLPALAASTPREYVLKAAALARNVRALASLRAMLRQRVLASPLCDARRFAREVEAAYRDMWRKWCDNPSQKPESKIQNNENDVLNSQPATHHSELTRQGGRG